MGSTLPASTFIFLLITHGKSQYNYSTKLFKIFECKCNELWSMPWGIDWPAWQGEHGLFLSNISLCRMGKVDFWEFITQQPSLHLTEPSETVWATWVAWLPFLKSGSSRRQILQRCLEALCLCWISTFTCHTTDLTSVFRGQSGECTPLTTNWELRHSNGVEFPGLPAQSQAKAH